MSNRKHAPATSRNREPILFELKHLLVATGKLLEIASGTGEHAAYFASHLPHLEWQPTDLDANSLKSIDAWAAEAGSDNILPALKIDVREKSWPLGTVDAIFNANMIHISHFDACIGLIEGAKRHLAPRGLLILYGPYRINDAHTAESNDSFDKDLRSRNPDWGIRDFELVRDECETRGLFLQARTPMPANNQLLVFCRSSA